MCGRFVQLWDDELQRYVEVFVPVEPDSSIMEQFTRDAARAYNIAPTRRIGILAATQEGPRLMSARWGFPLPNAKKDVFNTRLDSAGSPFWRGLMNKGRAITPAQGFYEWRKTGAKKQPMFIHRKDKKPMLFASVSGARKVGDVLTMCASILTCEPNQFMGTIHDRMPIILEPDQAREWLTSEDPALLTLIAKPAEDFLAAHEVSTDVNAPRMQGPQLMAPMEGEAAGNKPATRQQTLF